MLEHYYIVLLYPIWLNTGYINQQILIDHYVTSHMLIYPQVSPVGYPQLYEPLISQKSPYLCGFYPDYLQLYPPTITQNPLFAARLHRLQRHVETASDAHRHFRVRSLSRRQGDHECQGGARPTKMVSNMVHDSGWLVDHEKY